MIGGNKTVSFRDRIIMRPHLMPPRQWWLRRAIWQWRAKSLTAQRLLGMVRYGTSSADETMLVLEVSARPWWIRYPEVVWRLLKGEWRHRA